ncbi:MAG: NAD(P)H-dependent oxidoreductase subunit E [Chloroflexi bacterium]|nr:NAD(P)H-dependent oxidoreductase subunit E [Chloroflexota bacterium]
MIRVEVCQYCGATRAIIATVREFEQSYRDQVRLEIAQCLNECHNMPVVKVNNELVADATPPAVRDSIARALTQERAHG